MYILSTALATALLAGTSLALPAENTAQKKGIRSPAHRYLPKSALVSRDTGAVYASTDGGGWIIPVLIGGQQGIFNIDTGSSDLWTASSLMPKDQQSTVTTGEVYNPGSSSTYKRMEGSTYGLSYADGSGSSGEVGRDTVNIGGATIPDMPFGVCNDLKYGGSGSGTRDTDGPVGLGFGSENSIRPKPQCTFMECLMPYVPEPVFSTSFQHDNSGFIDFGYNDTSRYCGSVTTIPIANTSSGNEGQWVNQGVQFGSGGKVFRSAPIDMDFDSGTASLSLPWEAAADYFALVHGSSNSTGSWEYPCSTALPDFDFVFSKVSHGPATVTIPGSALRNGNGTSGTCGTWINVVDGRANAGLPFYISKYMIWNQALPSLSFADQKN